jgi:hypothetical protein
MKERFPKHDLSFAVVRDPWDRMVSYYHYTIEQLQGKHVTKKKDLTASLEMLDRGFDYFVENNGKPATIIHQHKLIQDIDLILRFENLEKDFEQIQDRLYCKIPLPLDNTSKHLPYKEYYTQQKTIDRVADLFEEDIKKYGYAF